MPERVRSARRALHPGNHGFRRPLEPYCRAVRTFFGSACG